jgi:subtilisin-like proprotein convertase family protein
MKNFLKGRLFGAALLAGALSLTTVSAEEVIFYGPGADIPDNNPGSPGVSVVKVDQPLIINDLKVEVNCDHDWIGDLKVSIEGPDGTTVVLMDRPGRDFNDPGAGDQPYMMYGSGHSDLRGDFVTSGGTPLNDTKTGPDGNGVSIATAPHEPLEDLSGFLGTNAEGNWTVRVEDHAQYDGRTGFTNGRIVQVKLTIEADLEPDIRVNPTMLEAGE